MFSLLSYGQAASTATAKEDERIHKVLADFIKAWNEHDARAFSNVFAEDADFTNVFGQGASGRAEIEKFHAPMFASIFKNTHQTISKTKIRYIKPDVAAVDAWWEMTGVKDPEGRDMPPRKGLLNFIMTKQGDAWLTTVMHNMDLREPPR